MKRAQKQREQLSRPRPLLSVITLGCLCIPWGALFLGNLYVRSQQAQLDTQAAHYFAQTPTLVNNSSAQQFDLLTAQLGLEPNVYYVPPVEIPPKAVRSYKAIERPLTMFIEGQANRVSGPLAPLPPDLQRYLHENRATLLQVQGHILSSPRPTWATDAEDVVDPNAISPGFVNVRAFQKLLLLSAISAHQQGREADMVSALEASWRLNEAIAQRSDLSSEVLVSVVSVWQAGLLRHLGRHPEHLSSDGPSIHTRPSGTLAHNWQPRLAAQAHTSPVLSGIRYETWRQYRITQQLWLPDAMPRQGTGPATKIGAFLANRFSFQTIFKLAAFDNTQTIHRALDQLAELDVCQTTQLSAEQTMRDIHAASWKNSSKLSPNVMAKRWKTSGNRALALELSHHVLAMHRAAAVQGEWPASLPPIASEVCPGESWLYTLSPKGVVGIELSKQLLTPGPIPLRYRNTTKPSP